ncbi:hypothetical protein lpymt_02695 [Legionella pneumophila]|nr:hypothetical protein lpymt_02695 [Legionella pneumophila]
MNNLSHTQHLTIARKVISEINLLSNKLSARY